MGCWEKLGEPLTLASDLIPIQSLLELSLSAMAHRQVAFLRGALRSSSAPPSDSYNAPSPDLASDSPMTPRRLSTDPPSNPNVATSTSLDLMNFLRRSEAAVVKTRSGSVLSRGFILKTDHYPSGACRHEIPHPHQSSFRAQAEPSTLT